VNLKLDPAARFPLLGPALLLCLALGWGLNWPLMKIALAEFPPWTFRGWITFIGGLTLLGVVRLTGPVPVPPPNEWRSLALAGLFNITGWNVLIAYGVMLVPSGHAALLAYTMPLWAILISKFALGEPIGWRRGLALGLGLFGIFSLMEGDLAAFSGAPLGVALCLAGALSWAIGTVIQKQRRTVLPVLALTGWQIIVGSLPILAIMPIVEGVSIPRASTAAWLAAASAAFVSIAFCYIVWFQMVKLFPVQVASVAVLLVPLVGMISGVLILDEPFGSPELLATGFIGCALLLIFFAPRTQPTPTASGV
jgi:drug/metabolite transporter (DMT)-like permease